MHRLKGTGNRTTQKIKYEPQGCRLVPFGSWKNDKMLIGDYAHWHFDWGPGLMVGIRRGPAVLYDGGDGGALAAVSKGPASGYFRAMPMPFRLAFATLDDTPRLARLVNSAYRGDTSRQGWTTEAHLLDGQRIDEEGLCEMLAVPEAAMLLCLDENDELLGSFYAHPTGRQVYLGMLAVSPAHQGQGVGKFLIRAAEQYGVEHGCTVSKMTVISVRAELIAFYERLGYRLTGATEPFPTDPRYGIPRQPLALAVLEKVL